MTMLPPLSPSPCRTWSISLLCSHLLLFALIITLHFAQSNAQSFHLPADGDQSLTVPSPANRRTTAKPQRIPLDGGLLHASGFFLNASVGGQHFTLQVDTKYSSLILPVKACQGCRIGDRRYDPSKSKHAHVIPCADPRCHSPLNDQCSPYLCHNCSPSGHCCVLNSKACAFNVRYSDGSGGNGTLYADHLVINDLTVPVLLGAMHEESHNFELPYADGVLGLGFQRGACRPTCFPPLMDIITNATALPNVFTMCVTPFGGTLVLGAADTTLAQSAYQYIDIIDDARDAYFITDAQPMWSVGDKELSLPGIVKAMWTTGTSHIGMSQTSFLALVQHLMDHHCDVPGLCSMVSWFRPNHCAILPEKILTMMPNITIGLSKRISLTLTPEDYLLRYRHVHGKLARCVGFVVANGLASQGIGLLLGSAVMRRYTVVHDRGAQRIGVAPAVTAQCGPSQGSEEGLPGIPGLQESNDSGSDSDAGTLTADTPTSPVDPSQSSGQTQEFLAKAEACRAERSCGGCAKRGTNCSYGYRTGKCVPLEEAGKRPYPYCSGGLCACFATGSSGWYFGIFIGVALTATVVGVIVLVVRKRRNANSYQMVQQFEEQDLETF